MWGAHGLRERRDRGGTETEDKVVGFGLGVFHARGAVMTGEECWTTFMVRMMSCPEECRSPGRRSSEGRGSIPWRYRCRTPGTPAPESGGPDSSGGGGSAFPGLEEEFFWNWDVVERGDLVSDRGPSLFVQDQPSAPDASLLFTVPPWRSARVTVTSRPPHQPALGLGQWSRSGVT